METSTDLAGAEPTVIVHDVQHPETTTIRKLVADEVHGSPLHWLLRGQRGKAPRVVDAGFASQTLTYDSVTAGNDLIKLLREKAPTRVVWAVLQNINAVKLLELTHRVSEGIL